MRSFCCVTIFYSLTLVSAAALRQPQSAFVVPPQKNDQIRNEVVTQVKNVAAAAVLSALMLVGPITPQPAIAVAPPLEAALIEASDATYPILKTLKPETVSPVFNSIVKLLLKVPSDKLVNFLDKGIDVILTIPDSDIESFTATIKDSYGDLATGSCDLVPLPIAAADKFTSSEALSQVDQAKLKALNDKIDATLKAIPKQSGEAAAICLPDEKSLEKIFIAQTELSLKLDKSALQAFNVAGTSLGKSIAPAEAFRLLPEFQKTERGVDAKARTRFEKAGKAVDSAIKRDVSFARLAGKM